MSSSFFQNRFVRKMPSPFLKFTEVPGKKGSLQMGDNVSGTMNFTSNALVTESGQSQFNPPGASVTRLGDCESFAGFLKRTPEIISWHPLVPEYLPDTKGLVFIIPVAVACATILRENMK